MSCGISFDLFWTLDLQEIQIILKSYKDGKEIELKSKKVEQYNSAYLIALFVGKMLDGKGIPSYEECFKEQQEIDEENRMALIKERLIDFMNNANKQRKRKE